MFKGILSAVGFNKSAVLTDEQRANADARAQEDKMIEISMKAYKNDRRGLTHDVAGIHVSEGIETSNTNAKCVDPWKSIYKRSIR